MRYILYRYNIYCREETNNFSQFEVSTAAVKEHATSFRSFELIKYAQEWDFQQVTLPPGICSTRHARGNGKIETSKKKQNIKKLMMTNKTYWNGETYQIQ